ncbi:MAG TPA: restriction endonuclease [Brevibacillus sp.]|nr:restriction endonuclease [Brevibacillus sp.]
MARKRYRNRGRSKGSTQLFSGPFVLICLVLFVLYHVFLGILSFFDWLWHGIEKVTVTQWVLILAFIFVSIIFVKKVKSNIRQRSREEYERALREKLKIEGHIELLKKSDPFDFERFIANVFTLKGYETTVTRKTGDGGKDIILRKGDEIAIVECKRYNSPKVTRPEIQKFHSAILDTRAKEGFFITTGVFTKPAVIYVVDKPIHLINGEGLRQLIAEVSDKLGTSD